MVTGQNGKNRIAVTILGEKFVLKSEEPSEYIEYIAATVDKCMQELQAAYPNLARHRMAILAALYLAEELERVKQENSDLLQTLREAR